jgi:hypothetical protein
MNYRGLKSDSRDDRGSYSGYDLLLLQIDTDWKEDGISWGTEKRP